MRSDAAFIKREFSEYAQKLFMPVTTTFGNQQTLPEYRARTARIVSRGEVVSAYILQANLNLWERGAGTDYPCHTLITFDPAQKHDRQFMTSLARRIVQLKDTQPVDPDMRAAAQIITNEVAIRDRRQVIPASLTEGAVVYATDLQLYRARLATGAITDSEIVCIAEPGAEGGIEQVPYWITMGMLAGAVKPDPVTSGEPRMPTFVSSTSWAGTDRRVFRLIFGAIAAISAISWSASRHMSTGNDQPSTDGSPTSVQQPLYQRSSGTPRTYYPPPNYPNNGVVMQHRPGMYFNGPGRPGGYNSYGRPRYGAGGDIEPPDPYASVRRYMPPGAPGMPPEPGARQPEPIGPQSASGAYSPQQENPSQDPAPGTVTTSADTGAPQQSTLDSTGAEAPPAAGGAVDQGAPQAGGGGAPVDQGGAPGGGGAVDQQPQQ